MKHIKTFERFIFESQLFEVSAESKVLYKKGVVNKLKDIQNTYINVRSKKENTFVLFYQPESVVFSMPKVNEFGDRDENDAQIEVSPYVILDSWEDGDYYPNKKAFFENPLGYASVKAISSELSFYGVSFSKYANHIKGKDCLGIFMVTPDQKIIDAIKENLMIKNLPILTAADAINQIKILSSDLLKVSWMNVESGEEKLEKEIALVLKAAQKVSKNAYQKGLSVSLDIVSSFKSTYVGKVEQSTTIEIDVKNRTIFAPGFGTTQVMDIKQLPKSLSGLADDIKKIHAKNFEKGEEDRAQDSLTRDAYK